MRRPFGVTLGWLIQVATFLCAFVLPMMLIVGVIFPCCGSPASGRGSGSTRSRPAGRRRPATRVGRVTTTERSLVLVKPDGFSRGLTGEVLRRIEAKGYTLVALPS